MINYDAMIVIHYAARFVEASQFIIELRQKVGLKDVLILVIFCLKCSFLRVRFRHPNWKHKLYSKICLSFGNLSLFATAQVCRGMGRSDSSTSVK